MIFADVRQNRPIRDKSPGFLGLFVFLGMIGENRQTSAAQDFA
jgi:hypothetical protein